ncbi:MAG: hypothetical protein AAF611_19345 [Bacteroidota bacterium]
MKIKHLQRNIFLLLTVFILTFSCSDNKQKIRDSKEVFLYSSAQMDIELKELKECRSSYKVIFWKYLKMSLKSIDINDKNYTELLPIKDSLSSILYVFNKHDDKNFIEELSIYDFKNLFVEFQNLKNFIEETDEDILPTFSKLFSKEKAFVPEQEQKRNLLEHVLLAGSSLILEDFGREITLYETSKITLNKVEENALKCFYRLFRGFLFFYEGLNNLTEKEITENIIWIKKNRRIDFRNVFGSYKEALSKGQAYNYMLSINYLLRGLNRLLMDGEKYLKNSSKDFNISLDKMNDLGINTEIITAARAYLHLKNENSVMAIRALLQLKKSNLLSNDDKLIIDKTVTYLKDRKRGDVLNGLYDKFFLSKIITKYSLNVIHEFDWEKFFKNNNSLFSKKVFEKLKSIPIYLEKIHKYTTLPKFNNLTKKGKQFLDRLKEWKN